LAFVPLLPAHDALFQNLASLYTKMAWGERKPALSRLPKSKGLRCCDEQPTTFEGGCLIYPLKQKLHIEATIFCW